MSNKLIDFIYYFDTNNKLIKGKKAFQKLVYFLSLRDCSFDYDYELHLYGPYSFELENDFSKLLKSNQIKINHLEDFSYTISTINCNNILSSNQTHSFNWLLTNFGDMTPKELEILCTSHYVINSLIKIHKITNEEVFLKTIKSVKSDKFSDDEIKDSIGKLKSLHLLALNDNLVAK